MRHIVIGTAGHVDHGKTALIKALTNIDCDTHREEKERGITINLGFAHINLPSGNSAGIIDVPGHKDFVKTMIAGAFGIDMVLLVIAADSGIMPQTVEHLQIIELLGVQKGIVVLTKRDLVDAEMLELAQLEVDEFLEATSLKGAPVIPVDSLSGNGIDHLRKEIEEMIPQLEAKPTGNFFRMYIDRVFNVKGMGYVVTGSAQGGTIGMGDELYMLPGRGKKLKVKNLQRHGSPVPNIQGGDRAALNLAGFNMEDYKRGMVLSEKPIEPAGMVDATLELFTDKTELDIWSRVVFYTGTFECAARIHLLNRDTLKKGEPGIVQIHLEEPAVLLNKDRFIIRNSANDLTLGGGMVIDTQPLHHRRRTPHLLRELNDLADTLLNSDKLINTIKLELKKHRQPVFVTQIAGSLDLSSEEIVRECTENSRGSVRIFGTEGNQLLVSREVQDHFHKIIVDTLEAFHRQNFLLDEGMDTAAFYGKFGMPLSDAGRLFIPVMLDELREEGVLKEVGNTFALSGHEAHMDKKAEAQLKWLEGLLKSYHLQTPIMREVEQAAVEEKISKERLKLLLKYLVKEGKLSVTEGEYIHTAIVDEVRKKLMPVLAEKERGINEKEFRLLFDSTKNFVKTMIRIFVGEGLITKSEFYIHITDKGRKWVTI